ncbi:hypothetical protein RAG64_27475, partial [Klebsiella pneumoniae]
KGTDSDVTKDLTKPAKIAITFDSVTAINLETLSEVMSQTYKIDERRLKSTQKSSRLLAGFTTETTISPSTLEPESKSPAAIANAAKAELKANLIAAGLPALEISDAEELDVEDYETPAFESPVWTNDEVSYVELNFTSTVDGFVCCEFELNPNLELTISSYDVQIGLSRDGKDNSEYHECAEVSADVSYAYSHNFTDEEYGEYVFTCTLCNNYPILPECTAE